MIIFTKHVCSCKESLVAWNCSKNDWGYPNALTNFCICSSVGTRSPFSIPEIEPSGRQAFLESSPLSRPRECRANSKENGQNFGRLLISDKCIPLRYKKSPVATRGIALRTVSLIYGFHQKAVEIGMNFVPLVPQRSG